MNCYAADLDPWLARVIRGCDRELRGQPRPMIEIAYTMPTHVRLINESRYGEDRSGKMHFDMQKSIDAVIEQALEATVPTVSNIGALPCPKNYQCQSM